MTTAAAPPAVPVTVRPAPAALQVWRSPLVPVALAATAGIILDRYLDIPIAISLIGALAALACFVLHGAGPRRMLGLVYLWTGCAALGAAYHNVHRSRAAPDDIVHFASEDGRPARVRGVIDSQPTVTPGTTDDPLRSFQRKASIRFLLQVTATQDLNSRDWQTASGVIQVTAQGRSEDLAAGDEIEALGRLSLPESPGNPGEFAYLSHLRDRQVSALLLVRDIRELRRLDRSRWSPSAWLAAPRTWGQDVLTGAIPGPHGDLATALLLGDSPGMTQNDWDQYQRTGVIHVLAISGQHLVVLAGFMWLAFRLAGLRHRRSAPLVALFLFLYALVAGGRPPVMRSAWMMLAYTGGVLLKRPIQHANVFALAWLLVVLWNPADVFNAGCQLSFLAVAVLVWGVPTLGSSDDPLKPLVDASRSWPMALLLDVGRWIGVAYLVNAMVWLAVAPLVAFHFHTVSPVALLLGPPLVLLTSIALLAGFAVLLLAPLGGPLLWPFAIATEWSMAGCSWLNGLGASLPGAYFYVPDVPSWWLWLFYPALLIGLARGAIQNHWRVGFGAIFGGVAIGLIALLWRPSPGEFRCTFLAVGHGGCAVIESPGGQVLLYDTGSISGPDVTRRHVAPYLWSRGIRRIDEVLLSHADLDHFNGLADLVDRFTVSRVTHTPSFGQRDMAPVRATLAAVERRGIPVRIASAGEHWDVDRLSIDVLHPPPEGPAGKENARSLVLLLRHRETAVLLTGDLEDDGLTRVLAMPPTKVDVLMAPHHGSANSNTKQLAEWASPRLVIICQARTDDTTAATKAYAETQSTVLGTWPHGAVTLRSGRSGARVETFRTGRQIVLSGSE